MKVIDLLNKIANGEICTGTHVIYRDREYIFTGSDLENIKEKCAIAMFGLDNLNNEVEIIEEKKKIPEKIFNGEFDELTKEAKLWKLFYKYNEIIDYLKSKGDE